MSLTLASAVLARAIPAYTNARNADADNIYPDDARDFVHDAIERAGTLADYAANHDQVETIRGRGPLFIVPGPGRARWVVRKLRHGGLLAPLTGDRFLRLGTPRPFNELLLAAELCERGIPTPAVVAAAVYLRGFLYRGEVAREEVRNARDLADCLFGEPALDGHQRTEVLTAAGQLIGSLHDAGIIHPDLNLRNVLIVERAAAVPQAFILDLEKCRTVGRLSRLSRRSMLRRFRRSARRFEERGGRPLSKSEWDAFRAGYAGN
jgi:3-deoxy-D-manno-octulosonic acid kinase